MKKISASLPAHPDDFATLKKCKQKQSADFDEMVNKQLQPKAAKIGTKRANSDFPAGDSLMGR